MRCREGGWKVREFVCTVAQRFIAATCTSHMENKVYFSANECDNETSDVKLR